MLVCLVDLSLVLTLSRQHPLQISYFSLESRDQIRFTIYLLLHLRNLERLGKDPSFERYYFLKKGRLLRPLTLSEPRLSFSLESKRTEFFSCLSHLY